MPVGALTIGCFLHSHVCTRIKAPYIRPIREALLQSEQQMIDELIHLASKHPTLKDIFLQKSSKLQRRRILLSEESKLLDMFGKIETLLDLVEQELALRPEGYWLNGLKFTTVDALLGLFLQRLYILGLEEYFWINKRPYIENYLSRFIERDSFKEAVPSTIKTMRAIWGKVPSSYKYAFYVIGAASATLASSMILSK